MTEEHSKTDRCDTHGEDLATCSGCYAEDIHTASLIPDRASQQENLQALEAELHELEATDPDLRQAAVRYHRRIRELHAKFNVERTVSPPSDEA